MHEAPISIVRADATAPARRPGAASRRGGAATPVVDPAVAAEVHAVLDGLPRQRDQLIEALHRINDRWGELAEDRLAAVVAWFGLPAAEVHGTASFYHRFHVAPPRGADAPAAPPRLLVCDGHACAMAGAHALLAAVQPLAQAHGATAHASACLGLCDRAPAVLVGQQACAPADAPAVGARLSAGAAHDRAHGAVATWPSAAPPDAYAALRRLVTGDHRPHAAVVDGVLAELDAAGLRGMGGAGFPAGRKWRAVLAQPGPRELVVNADESEPGTFKDRWLLEHEPHRVLEGLLIAAWALQAPRATIYLRDEYHALRARLHTELAALAAAPPVAGLPVVELRRGAGAYVCGEESALIESLEGKRGWPRLRPPYVAERGLHGRPTLVHNVETLAAVPMIVAGGGAAWAAAGVRGRRGWRLFGVSGRVARPGVYRLPAGTTLRELIDGPCGGMAAGHTLYAFMPGGASGGVLPASLADVPLDFDLLQPHGAFIGSAGIIVLSGADRARDAAREAMRFFADESCGQCTPCRSGTVQALARMDASVWDRDALAALSQAMRDASICGLGQAAPQALDGVMRHFPHEIDPR